jgi:3-deoxy-D-manno-octulosonic-acid transferase
MRSLAYNVILFVAAIFAIPYYGLKMLLTGKYRRSLGPKLGVGAAKIASSPKGAPRIWVHAVSVGEVTAAAPIIREIFLAIPGVEVILSTSTETGHQIAKELNLGVAVIYYPLDIPCVVKKVLHGVRADLFVLVETEIWPNFIRLCQKRGTGVVLVNGRLSPRSFGRYSATRFFWKGILGNIREAGMISLADAQRIEALGIPRERIHVLGNAKYDGFAATVSEELKQETAIRFGMDSGQEVFVAGSTHEGEETVVLNVYKRLLEIRPEMKLIIVPRHIERTRMVMELIHRGGFKDVLLMSQINAGKKRQNEQIVLVDLMGELFRVYSLATVVFCGGSLVKKGGQNILEAAAWGKVVFHGPYMDDFRDETALLHDANAAITVHNEEELYARIRKLIENPALLRDSGKAGRRAVAESRGAAARYAALIQKAL